MPYTYLLPAKITEQPFLIPCGEQWEKGKILRVLIAHQTHHRGQMTVIMRTLDLPVPGLYGPSTEEWADMVLPASL